MAYNYSTAAPSFSPENYTIPQENSENKLKSTMTLVDSLVEFYQQERMWIYRTRASLQNAFPMRPTTDNLKTYSDQRTAPDMMDPYNGYNDSMGNSQNSENSRWVRRKKDFKLRIDDLRARHTMSTRQDGQTQTSDGVLSPERILDMFEKMVEAKLESCQRVNKLVREANFVSLQYC